MHPMDPRGTFLPPALAQLVETKAQGQSLERELFELFLRGRRRVTIGIGPGVDLPLLKDELDTAGLRMTDRDVVVATIRAEPEGYTVERAVTNFGIYVKQPQNWASIGQGAEVRNLPPGTVLGLGSTPADAVKVTLPDGPWIATVHVRSARHAQLQTPQPARAGPDFRLPEGPPPGKETPVTPPTQGPHAAYRTNPGVGRTNPGVGRPPPRTLTPGEPPRRSTPAGAERTALPPKQPPALLSREYEARFRDALLHWKYSLVTFGGDPTSVLHLPDPALAKLRAAILRNLEQPDRGYEIFVKDADPDFWVQPRGEPVTWMQRGGAAKLRGAGNRLGFGRWVVELPEPTAVTARFGPRSTPSREDVAAVLELTPEQLEDGELVKARHRELVRRFHPDRTKSDPGATSRFVEIQQAFDAWKGR
jgi:hypothetical protein